MKQCSFCPASKCVAVGRGHQQCVKQALLDYLNKSPFSLASKGNNFGLGVNLMHVLQLVVDSINVSSKYLLTILSKCPFSLARKGNNFCLDDNLMYVLQLVVDASNVPSKYILTILSECATFPRRLIFFVKGSFAVGAVVLGGFLQSFYQFDAWLKWGLALTHRRCFAFPKSMLLLAQAGLRFVQLGVVPVWCC